MNFIPVVLFALAIYACNTNSKMDINPPAPGFRAEASDPKAITIADDVMQAMGGRSAYDSTTYIQWNFFGSRRHVWNKKTNDVVIEGIKDSFTIRMNLDSMEGTVIYQGIELTKADSLDKYLQLGKEMWINDSYWLVMPYKLKDSGVTLKYIGRDSTLAGKTADVLELTFADVGVTPKNKYLVYVDPKTNLISQWDFYRNYADDNPLFSTPWDEYHKYGKILLSSSRGEGRKLTEIDVGPQLASILAEN